MAALDRKALIAAYKEQTSVAGVFAVICTATGDAWVGKSRRIDIHQNGLWFSLKHGGYPNRSLQQAWNTHQADDFRFEQLDRLPEDISAMARDTELKERASRWCARLMAKPL